MASEQGVTCGSCGHRLPPIRGGGAMTCVCGLRIDCGRPGADRRGRARLVFVLLGLVALGMAALVLASRLTG